MQMFNAFFVQNLKIFFLEICLFLYLLNLHMVVLPIFIAYISLNYLYIISFPILVHKTGFHLHHRHIILQSVNVY